MDRTIIHSDMNNCYASIEIKMNPKWRGKPLAVCGSVEDRQGIVLAKSQEAKILGVKTGEVVWQAKNKCPDLILVPPHYDEYLKYSRAAKEIYYEYTSQVESFGLDECWLDVSGSLGLKGSSREIAEEIRGKIKNELGITVSQGISFNKAFAKLGSDMEKPDAITEISRENFEEKVWGLPVEAMIGVGRSRKKALNKLSIFSLGDLARADPDFLKRRLGIVGVYLWEYANGRDDSPVSSLGERPEIKSLGRSMTLREDLRNNSEVKQVFQGLSYEVSKKLRKNDLLAGGIQISVKDEDLNTRLFQAQLPFPSQSSLSLVDRADLLFRKSYKWDKAIRALGLRAINLERANSSYQLDFFSDYEYYFKMEKLDMSIYQIRERYGEESIGFLGLCNNKKIASGRTDVVTLPGGNGFDDYNFL